MSSRTKSVLVSVLLLSGIFVHFILGVIGIFLMWKWNVWNKWVKILITIFFGLPLFIFLILRFFILEFLPNQIKGEAMSPTYKNGAFIISKNLTSEKIKGGEIVILTSPRDSNIEFIKRVIAVPGDTLQITGGNIHLNGQLLEEAYLAPGTKTTNFQGGFTKDGEIYTIPENSYFVMGDNRQKSLDSREFGFVSQNLIKRRVLLCYWNCK